MVGKGAAIISLFCISLVLAGCEGPQSTLAPAGRAAERIATLFWWMAGGALLVWLSVVGIAVYAIKFSPGPHNPRTAKRLIIGGGVVFPTVVLAGLLAYGLRLLPDLVAPAPEGSLRVEVIGEQWWWRVRYSPDDDPIELANEIRAPVGEPMEFRLESRDVIHSFWIPSLAGKVDMIPGRVTRLVIEPTKTGVFRGVCAEYCGASHAFMNFGVVVMEKAEFNEWLDHQRTDAATPSDPVAIQGEALFVRNGCGACHAVRGTIADGTLGPDLTHVGSRVTLAAGLLENEQDDFHRWIAGADDLKPQAEMPRFDMLADEELEAMAVYLNGLE